MTTRGVTLGLRGVDNFGRMYYTNYVLNAVPEGLIQRFVGEDRLSPCARMQPPDGRH
jgi:hypothetical protein